MNNQRELFQGPNIFIYDNVYTYIYIYIYIFFF